MKYFNTLPFLTGTDSNGNSILLKNLLVRNKLLTELSKNPLLYYKYSIQESDTPELISFKYYNDQYRYWMLFLANEIMDPQGDWPLTSKQFELYINDKYGVVADEASQTPLSYTTSNIHHYEKLITTYDSASQTTVIKSVQVDLDTYNSITEKTMSSSFADGTSVTYTIGKKAVSIYDYEMQLNESKRDINIIKSNYTTAMESQFQKLMGS